MSANRPQTGGVCCSEPRTPLQKPEQTASHRLISQGSSSCSWIQAPKSDSRTFQKANCILDRFHRVVMDRPTRGVRFRQLGPASCCETESLNIVERISEKKHRATPRMELKVRIWNTSCVTPVHKHGTRNGSPANGFTTGGSGPWWCG